MQSRQSVFMQRERKDTTFSRFTNPDVVSYASFEAIFVSSPSWLLFESLFQCSCYRLSTKQLFVRRQKLLAFTQNRQLSHVVIETYNYYEKSVRVCSHFSTANICT